MFALSVVKLITTLRRKFKKIFMAGLKNVFSKEFRTLFLILMVFSGSYLVRSLCDVFPLFVFPDTLIATSEPCPAVKDAQDIVGWLILNLCIGFIYDFIPVCCVLLFHYRNFRLQRSPRNSGETASFQEQNQSNEEEEQHHLVVHWEANNTTVSL